MAGKRSKRTRAPAWTPIPGCLAIYVGKTSPLLRGGRKVRVVAEASNRRMVVEAIGHAGKPVRFPVLAENLGQLQPGLFSD